MKPSKNTLNIARLVHVYVSMTLLTLLLFFSVTGITLNHPEWFDSQQAQVIEKELTLDIKTATQHLGHNNLENINDNKNKNHIEITQLAEEAFKLSLSKATIENMSDELFFSIKSAGRNTSISIDLTTGEAFYESTYYGAWAYLNDLHKGRNTSEFWGWIIDLTSLLFIVFALSGFLLAMPQRRFRKTLSLSLVSTLAIIFSCAYFA